MTAIELLNLALLKIGNSKGIESLDEQSREALTGGQIYDHQLRATLRLFPWAFATKYAALELVQGPAYADDALVQAWDTAATYAIGDIVEHGDVFYYATAEHTNQEPPDDDFWSTEETEKANGDWLFAYRWPSDCLFARRMVQATGIGRAFDPDPITFRVGRDKNGLLLYSNEPAAVLEYTMIDCDALWADDLWIDAFTWKLAGLLAASLARDEKIIRTCQLMFLDAVQLAQVVGSREQQQEKSGDADHIRARS